MPEKTRANKLSPCHCANLRQASRAITQMYDRLLAPSGLSITQYAPLRHLARLGPMNSSQLAKHLGLDRTTLVRNLKPLQERGFLAPAPGPNPRARVLAITEAGLQALEEAKPHWDQAQQGLEDILGPQDLEALYALLEKIVSGPG